VPRLRARLTSVACAGLLVVGGLAVAGPAWATERSGSKGCGSTQQPNLTTTRGTDVIGAVTLHQWTWPGVTPQYRTGTDVRFSSSFAGESSGNYYASTASSSLTVNSVGCGPKAT
jgi:hypothetical protein